MFTIYALRSYLDGKAYIGCTSGKVAKRLREHRCLLRAGEHKCEPLQLAWNTQGESAFHIESIEISMYDDSVDTRRQCELKWMEYFEQRGLLYNEKQSFRPPDGAQAKAAAKRVANGYKPSEETKQKIGLAQRGVPKNHGAKISATKLARKNK
jgi:hypothetical protein